MLQWKEQYYYLTFTLVAVTVACPWWPPIVQQVPVVHVLTQCARKTMWARKVNSVLQRDIMEERPMSSSIVKEYDKLNSAPWGRYSKYILNFYIAVFQYFLVHRVCICLYLCIFFFNTYFSKCVSIFVVVNWGCAGQGTLHVLRRLLYHVIFWTAVRFSGIYFKS